jgi:hypothetical protein
MPPSWRREERSVTEISREECFAAWAPEDVIWSEWAKPVAFMQPAGMTSAEPISDAQLPTIPGPASSSSAIVVDLPGAEAVYAGLALLDRGFRPVPLFNGTSGPSAVIDVSIVATALAAGVERLKRRSPAPLAPPAFLLDARRYDPSVTVRPGAYDNRWIVLPQDFPSGALLASRGIQSATVVQRDGLSIRPDLAHVLRRWQEAGLSVRVIDLASGQTAEDVTVPKPSRFRSVWYAAAALLGLRRSNVGGFGSTIPEHTTRTGFYG